MFELPKALIDAGGWVTAAALALGIVALFVNDVLISRKRHEAEMARETARADKATAQLEREAEVNEQLTGEVGRLATEVGTLVDVLGRVLKVPRTHT